MPLIYSRIFFSCIIFFSVSFARKHELVLENDSRNYFSITTFGFFPGGQLEVNLNYLTLNANNIAYFGFTLTRTVSDSITPYMENRQSDCLLLPTAAEDENIESVTFLLLPKRKEVLVNCTKLSSGLEIEALPEDSSNSSNNADIVKKPVNSAPEYHNAAPPMIKQKRSADEGVALVAENSSAASVSKSVASSAQTLPEALDPDFEPVVDDTADGNEKSDILSDLGVESEKKKEADTLPSEPSVCISPKLPFKTDVIGTITKIHDLKFVVRIKSESAQGLYSLFFHNCAGFEQASMLINLSISIVEKNGESYLSAGEIPLPRLYFFMCFVFFITGCVWISVLRKKREEAFKIHYLMGLLVFVKSLSLLFHGINFHIIAKDGSPMEAWAVLYYITHLLKGALLFITIVLIGTGWAFIKHILSDKDKKIFMIVIPLQVLANVAKIIMEESEEGNSQHYTWREVFILVDLVCCGAILFPVVWSIRHLQEASHTDGKAAINLEKLKLFRHFYIMIVCYIYFTRIIVYLLKITVPFQYEWMDEMFRETATLVFFILTGYNFRPTTSNPYFRLSQEDVEMDEVLTQTGFTEAATKTVRSRDTSRNTDENSSTTTTTKRESSHEYD